ncbi:hypothetical protein [Phyllobacterium sophorae]|uniref:hypothetical protein n=1 Tax=Phyllobacterium sophorae TaxID=1520277 RepID=UPI0011B26B12|nr:hypothetical protein [Phyllobacterium sophorae]
MSFPTLLYVNVFSSRIAGMTGDPAEISPAGEEWAIHEADSKRQSSPVPTDQSSRTVGIP